MTAASAEEKSMQSALLSPERVSLCIWECLWTGSKWKSLWDVWLALIAMVLGPPKAPNVGGPGQGGRWATEGRRGRERGEAGSGEKEKETETERVRTRKFGLHPSSTICLCCRCGHKEGREKNLHKVIIIHMNADQILENCTQTHIWRLHTHYTVSFSQRKFAPLHTL